jgi:D-glycero-D-manno-heptose 1,7-bisphosphate phosphatase
MNKAIFLDRDGVINEDSGFIHRIADFKFLEGVCDSLVELQGLGFKLIIITNQSGIGRGYYSIEDFHRLNDFMLKSFGMKGITIDKVYFCPHSPEEKCECRKPKTKFIERAKEEFDLDLTNCWMIGDKISDIEMGKKAGCKTILIDSKYVRNSSEPKLNNLFEAMSLIKNSRL